MCWDCVVEQREGKDPRNWTPKCLTIENIGQLTANFTISGDAPRQVLVESTVFTCLVYIVMKSKVPRHACVLYINV